MSKQDDSKFDVSAIKALQAQGLGLRRIARAVPGLTPALAAYYMKFKASECTTHGAGWSKDGTCLKCRQKERSDAANATLAGKWHDPAFVARFSASASSAATALWEKGEYREGMAKARQNIPAVSSLNRTVMEILSRWEVEHISEYALGPWNFDVFVPSSNLLIECQGEYWHRATARERMDRSKATYVARHHPELRLLAVWEVEFFKPGQIHHILSKALGRITAPRAVNFASLSVEEAAVVDVRRLYESYHYHGSARGGRHYGLYSDGRMIGGCSFGPFQRQEQTEKYSGAQELTRFCIDPDWQVKNLGSWFLSRCLKRLGAPVVTYADTTMGHDGALYRACNFQFSHTVNPDYHYVDPDGVPMHKRTLWGRSRKMRMTESEYADAHGFERKWGGEKLCFTYGLPGNV